MGHWVERAGEVGAGEGLWMKGAGGWGSAKGRLDRRRCAGRRAIGPRVLSAVRRWVLGDCQNKEADGIENTLRAENGDWRACGEGRAGILGTERLASGRLCFE